MFHVVELLCALRVPRIAVLALISTGFAGCSADMSTRLSQDSFSNPFASQPEATASVPAPVERRELPQYARPQSLGQFSAPANAAPQSYPTASDSSSGGRGGVTSYAPPGQPIETTGRASPRSVAANRGSGHGGTTIIVGTSDTLDTLSRHYSVSPAAILQANGYRGPRVLSPGQQLFIPRPTTAAAAPASNAVAATAATSSVHVVNRGDTVLSIARRNHISIAELVKANNLDRSAKLKLGMKLTVPARKTAAAAEVLRPGVGAKPPTVTVSPATKLAAWIPKPQEKAWLAQASTTPTVVILPETPVKALTEAIGALPTFRWPARGKVITSYGAKPNAQGK